MPYEVREAKSSATSDAEASQGVGDRVFDSVEQAIDDFESTVGPSSIDHVDVTRTNSNRVAIVILYTA
jgi:hypothetical protein